LKHCTAENLCVDYVLTQL